MKTKDLINSVRNSTQQLWDAHLLFLQTNGEQGVRCFTPEAMQVLLNRTDEEIVQKAKSQGLVLEDEEEYFKTVKGEK